MAKTCVICQHAKVESINAALDANRPPNLVRAQYRLDAQMFAVHLSHRAAPEQGLTPIDASADTSNHLPGQSLTDATGHEALQTQVSEMLATSARYVEDLRNHLPGQSWRVVSSESSDAGAPGECCTCGWCVLSRYRRLLRAWQEASRVDRERLAIEAQMPEPPF